MTHSRRQKLIVVAASPEQNPRHTFQCPASTCHAPPGTTTAGRQCRRLGTLQLEDQPSAAALRNRVVFQATQAHACLMPLQLETHCRWKAVSIRLHKLADSKLDADRQTDLGLTPCGCLLFGSLGSFGGHETRRQSKHARCSLPHVRAGDTETLLGESNVSSPTTDTAGATVKWSGLGLIT